VVGFCEQGNEACVMLPGHLLPRLVYICSLLRKLCVTVNPFNYFNIQSLLVITHSAESHVIFDSLSYIHGQ